MDFNFSVSSVPKAFFVEISKGPFIPDQVLTITPKILDQGNNTIPGNISISLKDRFLKPLMSEIIESGKTSVFRFSIFNKPGNYTLETNAISQGVKFNYKETVSVEIYEKATITLNGSILYVKNIGNVNYKQPIEIEFTIQGQNTKKIIEPNIGLEKEEKYELNAPQGNYDLNIGAGEDSANFSNIPLTGSVIAIVDLDRPQVNLRGFWIFGIFIFMALMLLFFFRIGKVSQSRKELRGRYEPKMQKEEPENEKPVKIRQIKQETKERNAPKLERIIPRTSAQASQAISISGNVDSFDGTTDETVEKIFSKYSTKLQADTITPSLVYGTKQEITVLNADLNLSKLREIKKSNYSLYCNILSDYFAEIIKKINDFKGVADIYGDNLIVMFNVIKNPNHATNALKAAEAIKAITMEMNSILSRQNISLNTRFGINTGYANVGKIQNQEVKYTSIGSTFKLSSALQARANPGEILFSENTFKKVGGINSKKISTMATGDGEAMNFYALQNTTQARELARKSMQDYSSFVDRMNP
jgi:class 3 adenylate cyclase